MPPPVRRFAFGEPCRNPMPIGELLSHQARRDPGAPALTFEGRTWTRVALEEAANRRARALQAVGVQADDLVGIALSNGPEFHETAFAVWKLGATPAPLSHRLPALELDAILQQLQPRLVITTDPGGVRGRPAMTPTEILGEDLSPAPLPPLAPRYLKATTSGGSTGRPKVIVDHAPGVLDPDVIGLGMEIDDTILIPGPLYHTGPFGISHRALCRGAHVIEMGRFDAAAVLALISERKVRWTMMAPTMMRRIWALPAAQRNAADLSSLEMLVHMAAPCPPWLKRAFIDWLGADRIWEVYAGSERLGAACIGGRDWLAHPGSVGRPDPLSTRIVNDAGLDCPPGQVGEIRFRARSAAGTYHYLGAPPAGEGEWQTYGDLGHFDGDGYLYIDDRRTDMIVSGGANVYPAEVEAALEGHPAVAAAVVVGLPDDDLGQRLHAVIEAASRRRRPGAAALEVHLARHLARYKIPYTYEWVEGPLRDDAGKVRRSAWREACLEHLARGARLRPFRAHAAPR